jgi:hypothetical protein
MIAGESGSTRAEEVNAMIAYRDFLPRQLKAPRLSFDLGDMRGEYEHFDAAVAAANEWISESDARIINVETVVLPNVWSPYEGPEDAALAAGESAIWNQFLRVWYEVPENGRV